MHPNHKIFLAESERVAFDREHRDIIKFNMSKYDAAVEKGRLRYADLELAKMRASAIKRQVINHLDEYLLQFETNIKKHGVEVFWASDAKEAVSYIIDILKDAEAKSVVKSKSMTTEELDLNKELEAVGVTSYETDLGEFIVQTAGEKPYHIVTPAMHKSRKMVADLFTKYFDTPIDSSPEYITNWVRHFLRSKYTSAEVGITGANFLIADIGAISVTENEGNALLSTAFPKVHIAIAGIEKLIPKLSDLSLFLPLLAAHGTGQQISAYNTIFTGARHAKEIDGPPKMYMILLDNGRTNLLEQTEQFEALTCIRCGACLNACPVYKNIGGYTYSATYTGPIGSVITPHLNGLKEFKHLSFASSLCGKCSEVCAVKINLHKLLLFNRRDAVNKHFTGFVEQHLIGDYKRAMLNPKFLTFGSVKLKNMLIKRLENKMWGKYRCLPKARRTFRQLWNETEQQNP